MKTYIVSSNVNFTTVCIAKDPAEAVQKAARLSKMKYGFICEGLTACSIEEELTDDPNGMEIQFVY